MYVILAFNFRHFQPQSIDVLMHIDVGGRGEVRVTDNFLKIFRLHSCGSRYGRKRMTCAVRSEMIAVTQRVSVCYEGKVKGKSDSSENSTENAFMRLADIERTIDKEVQNLLDVYTEIDRAIKAVDDPISQTILRRRFLAFETMEQIAEGINYSVRETNRKYKKALDKVVTLCHCLSP